MNKRAKGGQPVKNEDPKPVSQAATPPEAPEDTNPADSAESKQKEKMPDFKAAIEAATAGKLLIRGQAADADLQRLVDKLLTEGSTFEDVVESARECGAKELTINAVRSYFLGSGKIQALRVRYMAETSESLMKGLGDDADTAEARLAKATMLTGLMNLHERVAPVTPKDAEHDRMERVNQNLKRQLFVVQRDKARQALRYTEEKIRVLRVSQQKVKEEIATLQKDAERHQAGEPLGPAMLQRIQQIYGLTCQMSEGGRGDAAKA